MESLFPVLHEDARYLAVDKPAGWETVSETESARCLTTALRRARALPRLQPCHRLDRDTTGAQLFAKSAEALQAAEDAFRRRAAEKQYLALCLGVPRNPTGTIRRNLGEWEGGHKPVRVVKGGGGLPAETDYRILAAGPVRGEVSALAPASLLLFHPHQGRTHQVRVHAAAFGYPILGDDQYGDRPANAELKRHGGLRRQALHAWRLSIPVLPEGEALRVEAPLPDDFRAALDACAIPWREPLAALPFR